MLVLTGAAGFIGSNMLRKLNEWGCSDVICVDDLKNDAKFKNLGGSQFSDYLDYRSLFRATRKIRLTGVIHLGACSDTNNNDGAEMMLKNHAYTKRVIQLAERKHCPVVYASSASVYGDGRRGFTEQAANIALPESMYAFSKLTTDHWVTSFLGTDITVPVAGMRYFNVYGPGEGHKGRMMSLAGKMFHAALKDEKTPLFHGSDEFRRDFIYVQDAVDVALFLFRNRVSGVFNVGTGVARSFAEMAEIANQLTGKTTYELTEMPEDMKTRYQRYTCADITKLRAAGYSADFTTLEVGMAQYWKALQETTHGTT